MSPYLGNDIVDIGRQRTVAPPHHPRYVERVCHPTEQDAIGQCAAPSVMLALLWAGKESAYKIGQKMCPTQRWTPRQLIVDAATLRALAGLLVRATTNGRCTRPGVRTGCIRCAGSAVQATWTLTADYVHCVAVGPTSTDEDLLVASEVCAAPSLTWATPGPIELSEAESSSASRPESLPVRRLARTLLRDRGLRHAEVIREAELGGWSPPRVWVNRIPQERLEVSMSHHGRYVAAAVGKRHCQGGVWCSAAT